MVKTSFYSDSGIESTDVASVVSNKEAAAASEAAAAVSEANAAASVGAAATKATEAAASATAASTSAAAANTSKVAAETAKAASETAQAASEAAQAAASASAVNAASSVSSTLLKANNLSDLTSVPTARTNLGLSTIAASGAYDDLSGAPAAATTSASGLMSNEDKEKLDNIQAGAKADQTALEIKTAYESNLSTNAFTDTYRLKLDGIQDNAKDDQTASEIKTAYESNSNTNPFTDVEKSKLNGIATSANNYVHPNHIGEVTSAADGATVIADNIIGEDKIRSGNTPSDGQFLRYRPSEMGKLKWESTAYETDSQIKAGYESNSDTNAFTDALKNKLNGIESGATADQTAIEIKSLYEGNSDTNVFTDQEKTKLSGIEAGATADQTASEIEAIVDHDNLQGVVANEHIDWTTDQGATNIHSGNYTDTNYSVGDGGLTEKNFTTALKTKVDGIEASADVTDTNTVRAAGALMDDELTDLSAVKGVNQGLSTTGSPSFAGLNLTGAFTSRGIDDDATSTAIKLHSDGAVTHPQQPSVNVTLSAYATNFNSLGSWQKMPFNSVHWDVGSDFNTTNNRFTAPVDGKYLIGMNMELMASGISWMCFAPSINGNANSTTQSAKGANWVDFTPSGTYYSISATFLLDLSADDYVEIKTRGSSGSFAVIGSYQSSLHIQLLG